MTKPDSSSLKWSLEVPNNAYIFGFLLTDGHLYRRKDRKNTGKATISLARRDREILEKIQTILPVNSSLIEKTGDTNFKKNYKSIALIIYDQGFRNLVRDFGLPEGKKSDIIAPPDVSYSKTDLFRGAIDGDGSLGITKKNVPFISLNTSSDSFANAYKTYIYEVLGIKNGATRNNRDNTYNICVWNEDAQVLIKTLYYPGCLALKRKKKKAKEVLNWKRPKHRIKQNPHKSWTPEQDAFIVSHSLQVSMKTLNRSQKSIKTRLWRLKKNSNERIS